MKKIRIKMKTDSWIFILILLAILLIMYFLTDLSEIDLEFGGVYDTIQVDEQCMSNT